MLLIAWTAGFAVLLIEGQQATAWAGVRLLIAAPTLAMWKMIGKAAVWFIVCIMAFLALFPWLYRYYGKRPFLWLLAASVLFDAFRSGTVMDYGRLYYQVSFHLWQFLLGMWCASWNMEQWKSPWRWFWIGAGAAWLLAAAGFLLGASLMRSFAQTVHYTVWHTADQIGSRGGWLEHFECRVRTSEISFADVRISPAARLMKRWPVFVTAGGCSPELPLFVYRSGEEALFRELLPEFRMPPDLLARTEQRSLIFFAPAGIPFALCLLLTLVSATVLPQLTVTLLIPTFFFGALLAGAAAGYRREGLWLREGRMTLRRQQGLYLHCICVFHPDVCLTAAQSPWAASVGRTNLTLTFPGWVKLKVRSVPLRDAEKFFRFMETN